MAEVVLARTHVHPGASVSAKVLSPVDVASAVTDSGLMRV